MLLEKMMWWMINMEKNEGLIKFQKEFLEEINETELDVQSLKKAKVSDDVLGAELALRKVFGDEIYVKPKLNEDVVGEKNIIKLTEEDISFDSNVQKICEDLIDNNFETGVNVILSKIADMEE